MASVSRNKSYGNSIYNSFIRNYLDCYLDELSASGRRIRLIKPTSRPLTGQKLKFLTIKEVWYTLRFTENTYLRLMARCLFETGLRISEFTNILGSDIDLKARTFVGIGKGNKEFEVHFSEGCAKMISAHLKTCKNPDRPFKIYSKFYPYNELKNQAFGAWKLVKIECEKLGLTGIHPHRFRHSLGHHLHEKGFLLEEIQQVLRHSNIATTQIYAPTDKSKVEAKLEREIFKTNSK
jgi:integrase